MYVCVWRSYGGLDIVQTLLLSHNQLSTVEGLEGLRACPELSVLDIQHNDIEDPAVRMRLFPHTNCCVPPPSCILVDVLGLFVPCAGAGLTGTIAEPEGAVPPGKSLCQEDPALPEDGCFSSETVRDFVPAGWSQILCAVLSMKLVACHLT